MIRPSNKRPPRVLPSSLKLPPHIRMVKPRATEKPSTSAPGKPSPLKYSDDPKVIKQLSDIKRRMASLETSYREMLQLHIVAACAAAKRLSNNLHEWRRFWRADWTGLKRPELKEMKDALRHVFRWVCGATKRGQQQASFYYRAMAPLVEQGLSEAALMKKLKKHGLRKLAQRHAQRSSGENTMPCLLRRRGRRWYMPVNIYFDREPTEFPEVTEHMTFAMNGKVMKVGSRLTLLAFNFREP